MKTLQKMKILGVECWRITMPKNKNAIDGSRDGTPYNLAAFNQWNDDERNVNVNRNDNDWNDNWWFGGVRNSLHSQSRF